MQVLTRVAEVVRKTKILSPNIHYYATNILFCNDIKICRDLRTFRKTLGNNSAFLGQKQCFSLRQEVHYYMVCILS